MNRFVQLTKLNQNLSRISSRQLQTTTVSLKPKKKKLKLNSLDLEKLENLRKNQPEVHPSVSTEIKKMSDKSKEQAVPTSRSGRVMTFAPMVLKIAGDVAGQYMKSGGSSNFRGSGQYTEESLRQHT